ncbi:MAG: hypothetical protein GY838_14000 [bacterium]|nr:hypothetical protein [bacterium]
MIRRKTGWLFMLGAAFMAGCGSGDTDEPASSLSRAQRDSILADSPLPGAAAVQGALDVADTASTRTQRIENLNKQD